MTAPWLWKRTQADPSCKVCFKKDGPSALRRLEHFEADLCHLRSSLLFYSVVVVVRGRGRGRGGGGGGGRGGGGGWWLVVGGWWLVVGGWWLVTGGWWLVVGGWWLVVGGWWWWWLLLWWWWYEHFSPCGLPLTPAVVGG